jgi:hypothetical protein
VTGFGLVMGGAVVIAEVVAGRPRVVGVPVAGRVVGLVAGLQIPVLPILAGAGPRIPVAASVAGVLAVGWVMGGLVAVSVAGVLAAGRVMGALVAASGTGVLAAG